MSLDNIKRREFLRHSGMLGGLIAGATPWALNLAAIGEAAAQTANDYKALVCIFLQGGNDHANTVVPYDDTNYNFYLAKRQSLAYRREDLAATALSAQMALAPGLAALKPLYDQQKLAVIANIGTLIRPVSKADYEARKNLPPKLFSHNDQQCFWQAGKPEGATSGWGGRIGDLMLSANGDSLFSAMSVAGNALYLSGNQVSQYSVSTQGAFGIRALESNLFGSPKSSLALDTLIKQSRPHQLENAYVNVTKRGLSGNAVLKTVLDPNGSLPFSTVFDANNPLAQQLKQVARLIANRGQLGAKRQVFFVALGGFDNHDNLSTAHPLLLRQVAGAMSSFFAAMKELNMSDSVTSFTASDFGRTLNVNEDGSDHGWGSHHFVMGGAVNGGKIHGTVPRLADPETDVGQGRLLPTTSVDQLGAALATWFGVAAGNMKIVLPNAGNFDLTKLQLFNTAQTRAQTAWR